MTIQVKKPEILALQKEMALEGIDVFFMQSGDPHNSEFVNPYYDCCRFVSGFTGENATVIVTAEEAFLWTDGRFFLQCEKELCGTGIQLMKYGEPDVLPPIDWLENLAKKGEYTLGFDGSVVTASMGMMLDDILEDYGVETVYEADLVGRIWKDRPAIEGGRIFRLPDESTGMSIEEKTMCLQFSMSALDANYILVSDLMETAWLTNLRGCDVEHTPVFFSYALIGDFETSLFVMDGALDEETAAYLKAANYRIRNYNEIYDALEKLPSNSTIWYDPATTCYALSLSIADGVGIVEEPTPVMMMKASKNDVEIAATRNAHIRDAVAVTEFIAWLKSKAKSIADGSEVITELDASAYLKERRFAQEGCFDLSFETIAAYGPNAAIIHYMPTEESNTVIEPHGFLLVDSGGQYMDGTTDITRTVAMGPLSEEERIDYTLVLKSHIAMACCRFQRGDSGKVVDEIARKPLRDAGLDFNHGLGHGVGHILGVHEGPSVLSRMSENAKFYSGMIMSDEPGVYIEGRFGIRIENEVLVQDMGGFMCFDTITLVPYDRDAIIVEMLTADELAWIDSYHKKVRETLLPRLTDNITIEYLKRATEPLRD